MAGLRIKANFTSDGLDKVGMGKANIGIYKWRRMETRTMYQKIYHKQESQVVRRKVTKQIRDHLMSKDETHTDMYNPNPTQRDDTKIECTEPIK